MAYLNMDDNLIDHESAPKGSAKTQNIWHMPCTVSRIPVFAVRPLKGSDLDIYKLAMQAFVGVISDNFWLFYVIKVIWLMLLSLSWVNPLLMALWQIF